MVALRTPSRLIRSAASGELISCLQVVRGDRLGRCGATRIARPGAGLRGSTSRATWLATAGRRTCLTVKPADSNAAVRVGRGQPVLHVVDFVGDQDGGHVGCLLGWWCRTTNDPPPRPAVHGGGPTAFVGIPTGAKLSVLPHVARRARHGSVGVTKPPGFPIRGERDDRTAAPRGADRHQHREEPRVVRRPVRLRRARPRGAPRRQRRPRGRARPRGLVDVRRDERAPDQRRRDLRPRPHRPRPRRLHRARPRDARRVGRRSSRRRASPTARSREHDWGWSLNFRDPDDVQLQLIAFASS